MAAVRGIVRTSFFLYVDAREREIKFSSAGKSRRRRRSKRCKYLHSGNPDVASQSWAGGRQSAHLRGFSVRTKHGNEVGKNLRLRFAGSKIVVDSRNRAGAVDRE